MTAPMTPDEARLRELAEAATPGPWRNGADPSHFDSPEVTDDRTFSYYVRTDEDAAFIAAANPATILALLNALSAERERADRAVGLLSEMSSMAETTTMELMHAHHHGPGWYTKGSAGMWSQIRMWADKCAAKVSEARAFLATQKAEGAP